MTSEAKPFADPGLMGNTGLSESNIGKGTIKSDFTGRWKTRHQVISLVLASWAPQGRGKSEIS